MELGLFPPAESDGRYQQEGGSDSPNDQRRHPFFFKRINDSIVGVIRPNENREYSSRCMPVIPPPAANLVRLAAELVFNDRDERTFPVHRHSDHVDHSSFDSLGA